MTPAAHALCTAQATDLRPPSSLSHSTNASMLSACPYGIDVMGMS